MNFYSHLVTTFCFTIKFYSHLPLSDIGSTLSELYNGITDETGTLSIASASGTDAGYYQCKVGRPLS